MAYDVALVFPSGYGDAAPAEVNGEEAACVARNEDLVVLSVGDGPDMEYRVYRVMPGYRLGDRIVRATLAVAWTVT